MEEGGGGIEDIGDDDEKKFDHGVFHEFDHDFGQGGGG